MLTSFFGKSKPVNYLIVAIFMVLFYAVHQFMAGKMLFSLSDVAFQAGMLFVFIFSMLLVDFVSRKNSLTKNNTFKIFVFAVFVTIFPVTFLEPEVLLANFFILLALRRIISLKTQKDIRKKIFDAALWISVASCFYFWSFLFIAVLFITIIGFAGNNFKNYIIPFLSMAAVIILVNTYTLAVQNAFYLPLDWAGTYGFDFTAYYELSLLIPIGLIAAVTVWVTANYFMNLKQKSKKHKRTVVLIFAIFATAVAIVLLAPSKTGAELVFTAMPFCILTANYLEQPDEKLFKELLMWALLFMPFFILFI